MENEVKENLGKNWDEYYGRYLTGLGLKQLGYKPNEIAKHLGYSDASKWNRVRRRFEYSMECADRTRRTPEEKEALYKKGMELKSQGMSNTEISKALDFSYPTGWHSFSYHYKNNSASQEEQIKHEAETDAVNTISEISKVILDMFNAITETIAKAKAELIELYNEAQP